MSRHPEAIYLGIKACFARLVELCGGQQMIVRNGLTRGNQTDLSRWASRNREHLHRMPPADVIVDLEEAAGQPVFTRFLAEQMNCLLVPLPEGEPGDAVDERMIRSARDYADMVGALIEAKRDGRITRHEAPKLLRDIRALMVELAALAEAVKESTREVAS